MLLARKIIIGIIIALSACKTQQVSQAISADQISGQIEKKLGDSTQQKNNFADTYILAWREDNSSGTLVIRYGVWDIETGDLIYAGTALRGSVQWLDNNSLLVEDYPGTVADKAENYKYKIDLNTKIKIPLHEEAH